MTEGYARALIEDGDDEPAWPTQTGVATVIAEVDGGMVPLVEANPESPDRRRGIVSLTRRTKPVITVHSCLNVACRRRNFSKTGGNDLNML